MAMGAERRRQSDALLVAAEAGDVPGVSIALGRGRAGPGRVQLLEALLGSGAVRGRPALARSGWGLAGPDGDETAESGGRGLAGIASVASGRLIAGPNTAAVRGFPAPDEPRGLGGFAPLHYACRRGRWEVAWLLLAAGANACLSARSFNGSGGGETPLQLAAEAGDAVSVGLLVAAGASVAAVGDDGTTPLHSAAQSGNHLAVVELLASGADPLARDRLGDTPLEAVSPLGSAPEAARIARDLAAAEEVAAGGDCSAPSATGTWAGRAALGGLPLVLLARVCTFLSREDAGAWALSCRRLALVKRLCTLPPAKERSGVSGASVGGGGLGDAAGGGAALGQGEAVSGPPVGAMSRMEPLPPGGAGSWEAALQAELGFGEDFAASGSAQEPSVARSDVGIAGSSRRRLQGAPRR